MSSLHTYMANETIFNITCETFKGLLTEILRMKENLGRNNSKRRNFRNAQVRFILRMVLLTVFHILYGRLLYTNSFILKLIPCPEPYQTIM